MALIDVQIQLQEGDNFISFPASYNDSIGALFRACGITNVTMFKFDFTGNYVQITDFDLEYIEGGRGYLLQTSADTSIFLISYSGEEYIITFDQFMSNLLRGWNLVGTGNNTIILQNWCKVLDPKSLNRVIQLDPKKAYLVNYEDCIKPEYGIGSTITVIGAVGTVLFTIYLMREFKLYPFNK